MPMNINVDIAYVGDSLHTMNNGPALVSIPQHVGHLFADRGYPGVKVRNYSLEGLRYDSALNATPGWLIGGQSPFYAMLADGVPDVVVFPLGVNSRNQQVFPNAKDELLALLRAAANASIHRIVVVKQKYWHDDGSPNKSVVTADEATYMQQTYAAIPEWVESFYINICGLFDMGMGVEAPGKTLHLTNSGKGWAASSELMYFQQTIPVPAVNRNVVALLGMSPEDQAAMIKLNT